MRNKPITKRVIYTNGLCDVYDHERQSVSLLRPFSLEGRWKDKMEICKELSKGGETVFGVNITAYEEKNYTLGEAEFLANGEVIQFEADDMG